MFIVFLIVVAVVFYFAYSYYSYLEKIKYYSTLLKTPKYFFMEPRFYFLFINIYDLRYYGLKTYFEAVEACDSFCNTLFLLNLDDSWNGIAQNYSALNSQDKMKLVQIKNLIQNLHTTRLKTINTLESLFITILPKDLLTEKLKTNIFKFNELMLVLTKKECVRLGLLHTEHTPVPYDKDTSEFTFFVN